MIWDYAEVNPFAEAAGDLSVTVEGIGRVLANLPEGPIGRAFAHCATQKITARPLTTSTDPPYFDNISYAELSDYFYNWMRRCLRPVMPDVFATVLTPKEAELVATPHRHGGQEEANRFFLTGMGTALRTVAQCVTTSVPITIYYAFKQSEAFDDGVSSTGWETFLTAVLDGNCHIDGTWPIRTERGARSISLDRNALASSIVLVCRVKGGEARTVTRSDFRRLLRQELPKALKALQKGNIAPVDMAQASIGPGMAIFSRHAKVIEADGSAMSVRTSLQLINEALDEYLAEQTGEFGPETRFAVTWFESHGFDTGKYGDAETLAKARNVSVQGVVESGILHSAAGKVRLLKRSELPNNWEPETDDRLTVWECTQHLIKRLEDKGETVAADLLSRLGERADPARDLAYRLYQTCERKGWAEEARAYNGLVVAWPELAKLAAQQKGSESGQQEMFS
jgi:putative DNA methylase